MDLEHEADRINDAIIDKLNLTFITPIDREDIYALANGLDDGHGAEDHAHSPALARAQPAHKGGIDQIIDVGHQHAEDGRNGQFCDQPHDGVLRHALILCPDICPVVHLL